MAARPPARIVASRVMRVLETGDYGRYVLFITGGPRKTQYDGRANQAGRRGRQAA